MTKQNAKLLEKRGENLDVEKKGHRISSLSMNIRSKIIDYYASKSSFYVNALGFRVMYVC